MGKTSRRSALLATLVSLVAATPALASDYCVNGPATCSGTNYTAGQLQQALTAASAQAGPDRVVIGPGTYSGQFTTSDPNGVTIVGSGEGQTILTNSSSGSWGLSVTGSANSSVSDLTLQLSGGNANGLYLASGQAQRITIDGNLQTGGRGAKLDTGATLSHATVKMTANAQAVGAFTGNAQVTDSTLTSGYTGFVCSGSSSGTTFTLTRVRITAQQGVSCDAGTVNVSDSVLLPTGANASGLLAQNLNAGTTPITFHGDRLTIVGDGSASQSGATSNTHGTNQSTTVTLHDSVVQNVTHPLDRTATGGTANLTADYVDEDPTGDINSNTTPGTGTLTRTHALNVSPGFLSSTDFHLTASSPLIDAGDPTAPPAGTTDLDGNARLIAGTSSCVLRDDIGAYEYQAPILAVAASPPPATAAFTPASFSAAIGCAPVAGDPITFAWSFDDGGSATGASASHAFTTAGTHVVTVTATDPAGRHGAASVAVQVIAAGAGPGSTPASAPVITATSQSASRWREGTALATFARDSPIGTTFGFTLNEAATSHLDFTQTVSGAKQGKQCAAQTKRNRHKRRCTRVVTVGSLTYGAHAGANKVRFSGRISSAKKLKPGRYTVVITATDSPGNRSAPQSLSFTIVKH